MKLIDQITNWISENTGVVAALLVAIYNYMVKHKNIIQSVTQFSIGAMCSTVLGPELAEIYNVKISFAGFLTGLLGYTIVETVWNINFQKLLEIYVSNRK